MYTGRITFSGRSDGVVNRGDRRVESTRLHEDATFSGDCFQAPILSTVTKCSIEVDRNMANLACHSPVSTIELLIENETTSDARTHFHINQTLCVAPNAITAFTKRTHIAIIIQR